MSCTGLAGGYRYKCEQLSLLGLGLSLDAKNRADFLDVAHLVGFVGIFVWLSKVSISRLATGMTYFALCSGQGFPFARNQPGSLGDVHACEVTALLALTVEAEVSGNWCFGPSIVLDEWQFSPGISLEVAGSLDLLTPAIKRSSCRIGFDDLEGSE